MKNKQNSQPMSCMKNLKEKWLENMCTQIDSNLPLTRFSVNVLKAEGTLTKSHTNSSVHKLLSKSNKVKGKFHPRTGHEVPEEYKYSATLSVTSALHRIECSMPQPCRFTPWTDTRQPFTGGWVASTASLDGCRKSRPHHDSNPGSSSLQRVAVPTELSRSIRHSKQPLNLPTFMRSVSNPNNGFMCKLHIINPNIHSGGKTRFLIKILKNQRFTTSCFHLTVL